MPHTTNEYKQLIVRASLTMSEALADARRNTEYKIIKKYCSGGLDDRL
jgi:hypothetical protein